MSQMDNATTKNSAPPQTEAQQYDVSSLRSLTWHEPKAVRQSKEYAAAYATADPNAFQDRSMKAAAVKGHINNYIQSKDFQSLDTHNKIFALQLLHQKYIVPALKDQGINPPNFDEWAAGVAAGTVEGKDTRPAGTLTKTFTSAASESLGRDVDLAANVVKTLFGHSDSAVNNMSAYRAERKLRDTAKSMKAVNTEYLSNFNVPNTKSQWAANMAGQAVGLAPMFALTEATGGAAAESLGAEAGGLTESILSFAERAGYGGKGSQIALRAMSEGGQMYGIDRAQGLSKEQANTDAIATVLLGGTLGSIFHGGARIKDAGIKTLVTKTIKSGAAKEGVAGEALINTVSDTITNPKTMENLSKEELMATPVPKSSAERIYSLVKDDDPNFIAAKQEEMGLREQWAQHFFPDKAAQYPGKVWNNLSKTNRARIISQISATQKQGAELMPLIQPEVQYAANMKEISEAVKANPALGQRLQQIHKDFGIDPVQAMTKAQATDAAASIGVSQPHQELENSFSEEEYEPLEGESASLGVGYNVAYMRNYKPSNVTLLDPRTSTKDFISGTIRYLERNPSTDSGRLYYEHPKMHLLAVAYDSDAAPAIKAKAKRILAREFNTDAARQKYEAGWLKFHVERLRDAGHIYGGNNPGRIFRSTKLLVPRFGTKYQKMLTPELAAMYSSEMFNKIGKTNPKLAQSLKKFYDLTSKKIVSTNQSATAMERLNDLRERHDEILAGK